MNKDFYGIEKMSLVDYDDKVSCVLFTKDCNLLCPFCHNSHLVLNNIELNSISFDEIITYLEQRKGIIDAVVISGGEPTLLFNLKDKISIIKSMGFLIKLDTNGTYPNIIKDLINSKLIDYIAMDIKNGPTNFVKTTNSNIALFDNIKESISLITSSNIDYEFRTTLIEEFHSEKDIIEIRELLKGVKKYYLQHFVNNENCINKDLHEIKKEKALYYQSLLDKYIDSVSLRGY